MEIRELIRLYKQCELETRENRTLDRKEYFELSLYASIEWLDSKTF